MGRKDLVQRLQKAGDREFFRHLVRGLGGEWRDMGTRISVLVDKGPMTIPEFKEEYAFACSGYLAGLGIIEEDPSLANNRQYIWGKRAAEKVFSLYDV